MVYQGLLWYSTSGRLYFKNFFIIFLVAELLDTETESLPVVAEETKKVCVGSYGSFTAQFKDGMCMSFSIYGPTGEPEGGNNKTRI